MTIIETVDVAILVGEHILLIRRAKPPFEDRWVLPGGHVDPQDQTLARAAARELEEEVGLSISPRALEPLMKLDGPDRDPRPGRRISHVFLLRLPSVALLTNCRAGSDAASFALHALSSLCREQIGFDHFEVIHALR